MSFDPRIAAKVAAKQYREETSRPAVGGGKYDRMGSPYWDRDSWEEFRREFGHYPRLNEGDIPNMAGAPPWAFELLGMRQPPVDVSTGSSGASASSVDSLAIWRTK